MIATRIFFSTTIPSYVIWSHRTALMSHKCNLFSSILLQGTRYAVVHFLSSITPASKLFRKLDVTWTRTAYVPECMVLAANPGKMLSLLNRQRILYGS